MYPWRYVRDRATGPLKRERRIQLAHTTGVLALILVAYVISPVLHETGHIVLLKLLKCHYTINYTFELKPGISSEISPMCGLSAFKRVLVFGAGITTEVFIALVLLAASFILLRKGSVVLSDFIMYVGLGFSVNPILYFFHGTGDLINVLAAMDLSGAAPALPLIGAAIAAAEIVYTVFHLKKSIGIYMKISRKVKTIQEFLDEIKAPEGL